MATKFARRHKSIRKKVKKRRKSVENKIKGECEINWVFVYTKPSDTSYYQHRAIYINQRRKKRMNIENETGKS